MPVVLANRIVRELTASRRSHFIEGILPDGKAQVTVEYEDGKPVRLDSVVVSCQHTEDKNLKKLEQEIKNKVLAPALRLLPADEDTLIYINPSGRFVCGGLDADTGLTGRKLMVDTYGSIVPHGGGAFSGKDCSKVDRSGAYMARYIAKIWWLPVSPADARYPLLTLSAWHSQSWCRWIPLERENLCG